MEKNSCTPIKGLLILSTIAIIPKLASTNIPPVLDCHNPWMKNLNCSEAMKLVKG
jgi:hypothetical protein